MNAGPGSGADQLYPGSMLVNVQLPGRCNQAFADAMRESSLLPPQTRLFRAQTMLLTYCGTGNAAAHMAAQMRARQNGRSGAHRANDACGNCGRTDGAEERMLRKCGRCRMQAYCGREW